MKNTKAVLQGVSLALVCVLCCAIAEEERKPSRSDILGKIEYHQRMEKQLSAANRFLSIKHPLSAGNPEFHARKAAELKKSLQ